MGYNRGVKRWHPVRNGKTMPYWDHTQRLEVGYGGNIALCESDPALVLLRTSDDRSSGYLTRMKLGRRSRSPISYEERLSDGRRGLYVAVPDRS